MHKTQQLGMGAVYWMRVAPGRREIDIDFAWEHAELPLVERKRNWGEKEGLRVVGRGCTVGQLLS